MMISGWLGFLQLLEEVHAAVRQFLQRLRTGAEMLVVVAQVADLADHADRQVADAPALADARIEHRSLEARIGADNQHRVRLLDAFDGRIEDIARASKRRIKRRAILPAIDIGEPSDGISSFSANISSTVARSPAIAPILSGRRRGNCFA